MFEGVRIRLFFFLLLLMLFSMLLLSCEKRKIPQDDKGIRIGFYWNEEESDSPGFLVLEEDQRFRFATHIAMSSNPNGTYHIEGDKLTLKAKEGNFVFTIKNKSELSLESFPKQYKSLSKWSIYKFRNPEEEKREEVKTENMGMDLPPMIMVGGKLYKDTGEFSTVGRCGNYDGEILYEVEQFQKPYKNEQSNFGIGYGYQFTGEKGKIDVYINRNWHVFEELKE